MCTTHILSIVVTIVFAYAALSGTRISHIYARMLQLAPCVLFASACFVSLSYLACTDIRIRTANGLRISCDCAAKHSWINLNDMNGMLACSSVLYAQTSSFYSASLLPSTSHLQTASYCVCRIMCEAVCFLLRVIYIYIYM